MDNSIIWKKCIKLYHLNLYFNLKGQFRNCCYQKKSYQQDFSNINSVLENRYIGELRDYMERWEEHPSCKHCYDIEAMGISSPRNMYNKLYLEQNNGLFPSEYSHHPKSLYFRFSNLCNFACRMCSTYSSTWRKKLDMELYDMEMWLVEFPQKILKELKNVEFLSQLDEIDIKGGEPFMHKQHFEFLDYLVQNNISSKIHLKYNTNLSILPGINGQITNILPSKYDSILDLWENFSHVTLRVSVEWYWKDNDYVRIGADWDKIESNIDILNGRENIHIWLTSTVQIDNLLFIPRLVVFAMNKWISLNISSHSFVYEPAHYNIKIIPKYVKKYVEKFYDICVQKYSISEKYAENLKNIIQYMNSGEMDPILLKEYLRCTKLTDKLYSLSWQNKLYELMIQKSHN